MSHFADMLFVMSDGRILSQRNIDNVNERLRASQSTLLNEMQASGVVDLFMDAWKQQPAAFCDLVRHLTTTYFPLEDQSKPNDLDPRAVALEYGLVVGAKLGQLIIYDELCGEYMGRSMKALASLAAHRDSSLIPDTMSFSGRDLLATLDPSLLGYTESATGIVDEYQDDLYAIGLGYTATTGLCVLVEAELSQAQNQDPSIATDFETGIQMLKRPGVISVADFEM